jgi:hypothetical protein
MRVSRNLSAWVMAALLLTALSGLAGGAGGQEVSEHGSPWIWVSLGKVTTFPGNLISPAPVTHVLEVPGGFADRHGIKTGDRVRWQ